MQEVKEKNQSSSQVASPQAEELTYVYKMLRVIHANTKHHHDNTHDTSIMQ